MEKTDENLKKAFAGESQAGRKYTAFAAKAMEQGMPEIAQLFMEAAGAETTHALSHLNVMGLVKSTTDNLRHASEGEKWEIEEMYPSFINQAIKDGRMDAKKSFEIALEREKHHRDMFRDAIKKLEETKGE